MKEQNVLELGENKDLIQYNFNSMFLSEALKKIPKHRKKEVVAYIIAKLTEIKYVLESEQKEQN